MDIRTKLVIVLVGVSLASMLAFGYFAFQTSADLLKQISERQLIALAESKASDVEKVITSWQDRVSLVASRTRLRINLEQYNRGPSEILVSDMRRILEDAQKSTKSVKGIALYDGSGKRIIHTGLGGEAPFRATPPPPEEVEYVASVDIGDDLLVVFNSALVLEDQVIGAITVFMNRYDLVTVTEDYTGLGDEGETLIAMQDAARIVVLHDLRHPLPAGRPFSDALIEAALSGEQKSYMGEHVDYRGKPVWGATRHIDNVNWGLAVQLNVDEELERVDQLRDSMIDLALSLSAFAILGGTILGVILARPIRVLANTVSRIRHGETSLRAEVKTEDEVGELAKALNDFLDQRDRP